MQGEGPSLCKGILNARLHRGSAPAVRLNQCAHQLLRRELIGWAEALWGGHGRHSDHIASRRLVHVIQSHPGDLPDFEADQVRVREGSISPEHVDPGDDSVWVQCSNLHELGIPALQRRRQPLGSHDPRLGPRSGAGRAGRAGRADRPGQKQGSCNSRRHSQPRPPP